MDRPLLLPRSLHQRMHPRGASLSRGSLVLPKAQRPDRRGERRQHGEANGILPNGGIGLFHARGSGGEDLQGVRVVAFHSGVWDVFESTDVHHRSGEECPVGVYGCGESYSQAFDGGFGEVEGIAECLRGCVMCDVACCMLRIGRNHVSIEDVTTLVSAERGQWAEKARLSYS
ncbi:hypothetical protein ACHAXS_004186 [Conticribra weissflogii]